MNKIARLSLTVLMVLVLLVGVTSVALADDYTSPSKITTTGSNTLAWSGQGASNGELETIECDENSTPYLLWIFTTDHGSVNGTPVLTVNGTEYTGNDFGGSWHIFTPYFAPDNNLTASVAFDVSDVGNGAWVLTISHGCPGPKDYEELTVNKTVETSYTRTHDWSIAKSVDPAEIYLYIPGQGALKPSTGTATWTVDVTYEGYADSDWNVSGEITIENTGTLDAVITSVDDVLAGTPISVDCGVTFPYTFVKGDTLTCSYSEDGYVEGFNVATVTTERDQYSSPEVNIVWGAPTTEVNKTVTVKDISDLFGEVILGTVTAPDNAQFTYTKDFAWGDYGDGACGNHTYNNTATIVETGESASATLTVHVQCHVYETAYGKGTTPTCFMPTFSNWGWTNYIAIKPTVQIWNLWAGAGQCDTSKGMLVGTVTVTYAANGFVSVTYNVSAPYSIKETHVYAGYTKFPKSGKSYTVAPGQYTNVGPFSGPIYVIAHAVVGIPDPNFGK